MTGKTEILATAYRYFLVAAKEGSMRAAAQKVNIASSAVNRQILLLEKQLNARLFDRTGRRLILTETGKIILRHIEQALNSYENALIEIDASRGLKVGRIRIATVESASVNLLPDLISRFHRSYPQIHISINVENSLSVTKAVLSGDADLGFTFNPGNPHGMEKVFSKDLKLGAILRPGHPLAKKSTTTLKDCCQFPLIYPAKGISLRNILDTISRRNKIDIHPAFEANSLRLMAALARDSDSVAFQTKVGIEHHLENGTLVFLPLSDKSLPVDEFSLLRPANRTLPLAAAAFIDNSLDELAKNLVQ